MGAEHPGGTQACRCKNTFAGSGTYRADGANAIVVGYGRFGQTGSQILVASDIPVTLIDTAGWRAGAGGRVGVERVAQHRVAQAGQVQAQLVRAPGDGF